VDRHGAPTNTRIAPVGDPTPTAGSLLQAATRRRRAQRAFEDRVRVMARRFAPSGDDGAGARRPLPRV
jgi:hypothetical protein